MENKKIMICDDNQDIVDVLNIMLETEGYTVFSEIDSTKLIDGIKQQTPDLLLLDLWMPVLSGDQIVKLIRESNDIKHLPVIILSASIDGNDIAQNVGANGFIAKPFNIEDIFDVIKNTLVN